MHLQTSFLLLAFTFAFNIVFASKRGGYGRANAGTSTDNPFALPVDNKTCTHNGHQLQIKRALKDLEEIVELGLDTLYSSPTSTVVAKYFGHINHGAELITPIGILTRLQKGTKKNVVLHCGTKDDETEDNGIATDDWTVCNSSKRFSSEGGFVEQINRKHSKQISVITCPQSFAPSTHRLYLEEICQNDFTLNDNVPTTYWPISLLSLFMQVPQLSSPLMQLDKRDYANVLDLAHRDPEMAKHNIYTYLYFLLDVYARKNYSPNGCSGQPSGRVYEEPWN
ncbi:uncharacterized protein FA14DRAFT_177696 [Meira miltonrushii]|uniref:Putative peptidase domain-containing protein n=1 Tax=Meira miltonrushii TaxID=1280837 RepID=A0A316VQI4_9BASI|nr:uncharacterized protein FA14DRAFT_177696 [Meira miltonrushii]PWN38421.1 hypothetical protein FA14DRAFT_177696 [Meira miltonrushii]